VKTSDLDYELPPELIAQHPSKTRGDSRLMVLDRRRQQVRHCHFTDLPQLTEADDLFVLNNTRVFPARLFARKEGLDRKIEVLLLKQLGDQTWEVLIRPGRRVPVGTRLVFDSVGLSAKALTGEDSSKRRLEFQCDGHFWDWLERLGEVPLPPYIKRSGTQWKKLDKERYQTIYAKEQRSVAAPTAGLHFTEPVLKRIRHCEITLHVGYGTFKPITAEELEEHKMESEFYSIGKRAVSQINENVDSRSRTIAVGTTTTRALEHAASETGKVAEGSGYTDLFIFPGYRFRAIQGLLTNFHLPGSTLLALVSAFAGKELIRRAYAEAIQNQYRFYSYGDAMLIL
jgi:S-adenosylmethionine:tRNA ribosyltransferase-isomerase